MKNISAFIKETYRTTKFNYLSRIVYELNTVKGCDGTMDQYTKSWETVDSELKNDKNIGRQLNKTSVTKGLLDAKIESEQNDLSKTKDIFQFVQNRYTWYKEYHICNDVSIKNLNKKNLAMFPKSIFYFIIY